jgi:hypothetical protein
MPEKSFKIMDIAGRPYMHNLPFCLSHTHTHTHTHTHARTHAHTHTDTPQAAEDFRQQAKTLTPPCPDPQQGAHLGGMRDVGVGVGTEEIGPPPERREGSEKEKGEFRAKRVALKTQRNAWALDTNRFLPDNMAKQKCHAQCDRRCFEMLCKIEESISNCYMMVRGIFKCDMVSSHICQLRLFAGEKGPGVSCGIVRVTPERDRRCD